MWSLFLLFLGLFIAIMQPHDAFAKGKKKSAPNNKYASILTDAATGEVLYARNADKPLHPASLTKVMTLMLLFDALESGNVRLNDRIPISRQATYQKPSKLGLEAGSSIRVEDAILAVVTKSANDIAFAIAEFLAGNESRFAARMTERARDIGMSRTNFVNASGLHDSRQISTAHDMAILARYILVRYPNYYRYFGTKQFTYRGKTMSNHNHLMKTYKGMDGFKTGFINASGFNLIASAKRDGKRLIGVVFGGQSTKSRNDHMAELLDAGFAKINDPLYAAKQPEPVQTKTEQVVAVQKTTSTLALPATAAEPRPAPPASDLWSVQIGAYTSRVATDDALRIARQKLPATLSYATPIVVPLETSEGLLFRARLGGFTENQAVEACRFFKDCLPVAPRS